VQGVSYSVPANSTLPVDVTGLLDGKQTISIASGNTDFSQQVTIGCDLAPTISHSQTCVESDGGISDGQVIVTLNNNGDDVPMTFTVNGIDHAVGPKQSVDVPVAGLADGTNEITITVGDLDLSVDIDISCDHPGVPTIEIQSDCADNDGIVVVILGAIGGELPIDFTVQGVHYSADPDSTVYAVIEGLLDGDTHISVFAGQQDMSFITQTQCDLAPLVNYSQACANFDDTVTVTISNEGDDVDVTFTINGNYYVLHPGESMPVVVGPLDDGTNTITVSINDMPQDDIVVESNCNPAIDVTAVCNSTSLDQTVGDWFTVTNTEGTDVALTWNGGSATVPAGQSMTIEATSAPLVLMNNGQTISETAASESECPPQVTSGNPGVQIDKQTPNTVVVAGGQITYTLKVTNTGALPLNPFEVYDRLPAMVSLVSAQVADGAGQCTLAESTRPQLVTCKFNAALAPGAVSSLITLVVKVDSNVIAGTAILNQAMVQGVYGENLEAVGTNGPVLSCLPVVAGTVCDLSALVEVPVSQPRVDVLPPSPTVASNSTQLPHTGASHLKNMLLLGLGSMLLGGALLIGRRRRVATR
ncbi:MAG TPA: LPXTG cell wall anchor domain-containing protein, partial [Ilumatobacteraceae bacterium]